MLSLSERISAAIPEKLANEMVLERTLYGPGPDNGPTTAIAVMVHKVNERSQGNVIRLYRFIEIGDKYEFVLKSELAAFSLPDAKIATSFAGDFFNMSVEELFVSLEEEGGKMVSMAPLLIN